MINEKFLMNDWEQSGNTETELNKMLSSIDDATKQLKVNLTEFYVEHIYEDSVGDVWAYVIDPDNVLPNGQLADDQVNVNFLDDVLPEFRHESL